MTQIDLLDAPPVRQSLTDRLAAYFRAHPDEWVDAHVLLGIAGFAGWRTRCSELRHAPYFMTIENRTRRGQGYTESCYCYQPRKKETR